MKVPFYLKDGSEKRAVVCFKGNSITSLICDGFPYKNNDSFKENYDYSTFVTSNDELREFLIVNGFTVRDSERVNTPIHVALPLWAIQKLDLLCKNKYFNYSRSDLINEILYKGFDHTPAANSYEKKLRKTMVTLNPVVLMELENKSRLRDITKNHLVYDYVMEFLEYEDA